MLFHNDLKNNVGIFKVSLINYCFAWRPTAMVVLVMMMNLFVNMSFTIMSYRFIVFVVPAAMMVFVMMVVADLFANISFMVFW